MLCNDRAKSAAKVTSASVSATSPTTSPLRASNRRALRPIASPAIAAEVGRLVPRNAGKSAKRSTAAVAVSAVNPTLRQPTDRLSVADGEPQITLVGGPDAAKVAIAVVANDATTRPAIPPSAAI